MYALCEPPPHVSVPLFLHLSGTHTHTYVQSLVYLCGRFDELQLLVLSILPSLVPSVLSLVTSHGLTQHLVSMLAWAFNSGVEESRHHRTKKMQGAANSFLATQDFSVHRLQEESADPSLNNGKRVHALHIMKTLEVLLLAADGTHGSSGGHGGVDQSVGGGGVAALETSQQQQEEDLQEDRESRRSIIQHMLDSGLMAVVLAYLSKFTPTSDDMLLTLKTHAWTICSLLCIARPDAQVRREGRKASRCVCVCVCV